MPSLKELQNQLFNSLKKVPHIEDFFRDQLTERVKSDLWIDNPLIQMILMDRETPALNTLLESIKTDSKIYAALKAKQNRKGGIAYDEQMNDLMAELHGYHYLNKKGFKDIESVTSGDGRVPDFIAQLNGKRYAAEVKQMRSPIEGSDYVIQKIYSSRLTEPVLFDNKFFSVTVESSDHENFDCDDKHAVTQWIVKMVNEFRFGFGEGEINFSYKKSIDGREVLKGISCEIKCGDSGIMVQNARSGSTSGRFGTTIDGKFKSVWLIPFIRKVWNKINEAMDQLYEYDSQNYMKKLILLNWSMPLEMVLIKDEAVKCFREIEETVNESIDSDLSVVLLNDAE